MTLTNFNATTPQSKVVENIFKAVAARDIKSVEPFLSKDLKAETFPKIASLPDVSKALSLERYGTIISLFTKIEVIVHELIEAQEKVVLQCSSVCHTPDGDKIEYDSLCIITVIEEDGELKVNSFKDFSDPEKRANVHGWAAKAFAKRAT